VNVGTIRVRSSFPLVQRERVGIGATPAEGAGGAAPP